MPANIDSLYQEMGRAGRDGNESTCLLLFAKKDKSLQSYFIQSSQAPAEIKRSRWNTLNALLDYMESSECRHAGILTYYKDAQRLKRCGHCDVCDPASPRKIAQPQFQTRTLHPSTLPTQKVTTLKKKSKKGFTDLPLTDSEKMRFELLRDWRKQKADELDMPAFVVFSDRTLREVARTNPNTVSALTKIHGFGEVKLERFGKEILAVLEG